MALSPWIHILLLKPIKYLIENIMLSILATRPVILSPIL